MTKRDGYQRYLDAGIAFTQMTRSRAEELVQELVKSGEVQGKEARTKVEELIERSRKSSESLLSVVRDEVGNQLHSMGVSNIEDLAKQVASLLGRSSKAASGAARKSAAKKAPAKKAAAKKAPAKKAPAKKAPAKKAAAKKAAAKKASGPRSRA
jgi:polyhydroxyalkanoate synthesis regulator phasin